MILGISDIFCRKKISVHLYLEPDSFLSGDGVRRETPLHEAVLSQGRSRVPLPADPLGISHTKLGGEAV